MNLGPNDSINYYEDALNSLSDFDTDDEILYSLSTGLKGDANLELGNYDKALNYYVSAANDYVNDFTTPYFMMKQAFVHEINEDYNSALKIYESIKEKYSQSKEGLSIDKYISSSTDKTIIDVTNNNLLNYNLEDIPNSKGMRFTVIVSNGTIILQKFI